MNEASNGDAECRGNARVSALTGPACGYVELVRTGVETLSPHEGDPPSMPPGGP